jgi:ribonuclease T2
MIAALLLLAWPASAQDDRARAFDHYVFALSRLAYDSLERPDAIRRLDREVRLSARVVGAVFLEGNPDLSPGGVTVTCRPGRVQEVRLRLTRDLAPRGCGSDLRRDCALDDALLSPIR